MTKSSLMCVVHFAFHAGETRMKKALVAWLAALGTATAAIAQQSPIPSYPTRPITIVVPFPPGGGSDAVARIVAERMRTTLGQPVVVENVPGADGTIGTGKVARAAPDGYTLVLGYWSNFVSNGAIYSLQYDIAKDFEPISLITEAGRFIVARKTLPANDLNGLIAWLKANPDKATFGTSGHGGAEHLAGLLFQKTTGTSFQFIPYRGTGPALQSLLGEQIDMMLIGTESYPHIRAGNIKVYAVTSRTRFPGMPDVPTADEAGLQGMHFSAWTSLWAPRGTHKDIIAKLNAAVTEALADATTRSRFNDPTVIVPRERQTPSVLRELQRADIETWWPVIKAAGIKTD